MGLSEELPPKDSLFLNIIPEGSPHFCLQGGYRDLRFRKQNTTSRISFVRSSRKERWWKRTLGTNPWKAFGTKAASRKPKRSRDLAQARQYRACLFFYPKMVVFGEPPETHKKRAPSKRTQVKTTRARSSFRILGTSSPT